MSPIKLFVIVALCIVLNGCSGNDEPSQDRISTILFNSIFSGGNQQGQITHFDPTNGFTRAQIEELPGPTILLYRPDLPLWGTIMLAAKNGENTSYFSSDGAGFTYVNGVLRSTRGIGEDMYASEVQPVVLALSQGGGHYTRTYRFLTPLNALDSVTVTCHLQLVGRESITIMLLSYDTHKYSESCAGDGQSFENTYWIDGAGLVLQSHQWVSPIKGSFDFYLLR